MFLTQWARCHCAEAHCSAETSAQPGQSLPVRLYQLPVPIGVRLVDHSNTCPSWVESPDDGSRFRSVTQEHPVCIVTDDKFY
jgi:hypothetical protein